MEFSLTKNQGNEHKSMTKAVNPHRTYAEGTLLYAQRREWFLSESDNWQAWLSNQKQSGAIVYFSSSILFPNVYASGISKKQEEGGT